MAIDPAGMTFDVVRAEASRFRHPLLLLHGLWTGGWIWRDIAPYLAHRGWDAWIPSFLGDDRTAMDPADRRAALDRLCRELPAPPIVVTHDAGAVTADAIARDLEVPAMVMIAPVVGTSPALMHPRFWAARLGARSFGPPGGRSAAPLVAGLSPAEMMSLVPDSGRFFRAVASAKVRMPAVPRGFVVTARGDVAAPFAVCEHIARARGWDVDVVDAAGHFPIRGAAATDLADRIHRWIVRTLGRDLLAWVDGDEDEE